MSGSFGSLAAAAYLREEVLTASPLRLVIRVLAGAIAACERARVAAEKKNSIEWRRELMKAHGLVTELYGALDADQGGEIAARLSALYQYMLSRLLVAGARPDPTHAANAARLLQQLKLGFDALVARENEHAEQC